MALVTTINESVECLWMCQNLNKCLNVSGLCPSPVECVVSNLSVLVFFFFSDLQMSCTSVRVSCWWLYHGNIRSRLTRGCEECGIHFRSVLENKRRRLPIDNNQQIFRQIKSWKWCGYWPDIWHSQEKWSDKDFKCQQQLWQGWSSSDWSYFVSLNKCINYGNCGSGWHKSELINQVFNIMGNVRRNMVTTVTASRLRDHFFLGIYLVLINMCFINVFS